MDSVRPVPPEQQPGSKPRAIRIGVAGPPGSGKSEIADLAAAELGATVLRLDDFFIPGHVKRKVVGADGRLLVSYAHPGAFDGAALARSLARVETPFVVAEGFLLFCYGASGTTYDLRVFVRQEWESAERRLTERSATTGRMVEDCFRSIARQEWEAFGAPQEAVADLILDGENPIAVNAGLVADWGRRVARLVDTDIAI
jgi:uridine kinase